MPGSRTRQRSSASARRTAVPATGRRPPAPPARRPAGGRPRLLALLAAIIAVVALVGAGRATGMGSLVRAAAHSVSQAASGPSAPAPVPVATETPRPVPSVAPVGQLVTPDVLLTSTTPIPANEITELQSMPGVQRVEPFSFGKVQMAGATIPAYGVDPSSFRNWATRLTAVSDPFWRSIAAGEISASFQTAQDLRLPLGAHLPIAARSSEPMRLGSFATVGVPDAEAVLSTARADEIGLPRNTGLLISAPTADLRDLTGLLGATLGPAVAVRPLHELPPLPQPQAVIPAPSPPPLPSPLPSIPSEEPSPLATLPTLPPLPSQAALPPSSGFSTVTGSGTADAVIAAAKSRLGDPYVYGAAGPDSFDCSGLTSWSYAQAGMQIPRTAQEQWLAGPHVPYSQAQPGDILAWAGDPNAPGYATHVAIYLGNGQMISAPHSGTTVSISSVYTSGLMGAVHLLQ